MESTGEKAENICPNVNDQLCTFSFVASQLPSKFKHEITDASNDEEYVVRANIDTENDISKWIRDFGTSTRTQWNFRRSRLGSHKVFKEFICHHSSFKKQPTDENGHNKKGISKNTGCLARIRVSVNMTAGKRACKRDPFLRDGLWGTIRVGRLHTHPLKTATILRYLQDKSGTLRETFLKYFENGMSAAEAKHHHELELKLNDASEIDFANGTVNPTSQAILHWFKQWRSLKLKPKSFENSENTENSDAKRCKLSNTQVESKPQAAANKLTANFRGNKKSVKKVNTTILDPQKNRILEERLSSLRKIAPKPNPEEMKSNDAKRCKLADIKSTGEIEPINVDRLNDVTSRKPLSSPSERIEERLMPYAVEHEPPVEFQAVSSNIHLSLHSSHENTKSTDKADVIIVHPLKNQIPDVRSLSLPEVAPKPIPSSKCILGADFRNVTNDMPSPPSIENITIVAPLMNECLLKSETLLRVEQNPIVEVKLIKENEKLNRENAELKLQMQKLKTQRDKEIEELKLQLFQLSQKK